MQYFLAAVLLVIGVAFLLNWILNAPAKNVLGALRWLALLVGAAILVIVLLTRNIGLVVWLLPLLLPWVIRGMHLRRAFRTMRGPSPGKQSHMSTRYLDMTLDHESGVMDGTVKLGAFAERRLSDLTSDECIRLHGELAAEDPQSLRLLEAFLDRAYGAAWRADVYGEGNEGAETDAQGERASRSGRRARAGRGGMSRDEAFDLLGLAPGASEAEIRKAHRRLMKTAHPDRGGSAELAALLNEAKDVLLGKG